MGAYTSKLSLCRPTMKLNQITTVTHLYHIVDSPNNGLNFWFYKSLNTMMLNSTIYIKRNYYIIEIAFMKWIVLHEWEDGNCVKMLRNCWKSGCGASSLSRIGNPHMEINFSPFVILHPSFVVPILLFHAFLLFIVITFNFLLTLGFWPVLVVTPTRTTFSWSSLDIIRAWISWENDILSSLVFALTFFLELSSRNIIKY